MLRRLLLLALSFGYAGAEQQISIDLDPAKTKIAFVLGDVLHKVHGTFDLKSGHIDFDPATGLASGEAIVNAASGDSGSGARDRRMKRDILEVDRYPVITFTPEKVTGALSPNGDSSLTVSGWFAIHGQRRHIALPVNVKVSGSEITATGRLVVPYVAWGMKNPSTFILRVDDHVDITVAAVGRYRQR